jgi:hypothetical protein
VIVQAISPQNQYFTSNEILDLCGLDGSIQVDDVSFSDSIFDYLFRPQGVTKILFHTTKKTQIRFRWWRKSEVVIIINLPEWECISPELKYFVLNHEIGHLKKLSIGTLSETITMNDENQADDFALSRCQKIGFGFKSAEEVRKLYQSSIYNQSNQQKE